MLNRSHLMHPLEASLLYPLAMVVSTISGGEDHRYPLLDGYFPHLVDAGAKSHRDVNSKGLVCHGTCPSDILPQPFWIAQGTGGNDAKAPCFGNGRGQG